jgi:hypothetical protein
MTAFATCSPAVLHTSYASTAVVLITLANLVAAAFKRSKALLVRTAYWVQVTEFGKLDANS